MHAVVSDDLVDRLCQQVSVEVRDYRKRVMGRVIEMLSGPYADHRQEQAAAAVTRPEDSRAGDAPS